MITIFNQTNFFLKSNNSLQNCEELTLDQNIELVRLDPLGVEVNLQGQQQSEHELVLLIKTSDRIAETLIGQSVNHIGDPLARDWRFDRQFHGKVENAQELFQRSLVHDIDHAHLHNQEVQNATSVRD